MPSPAPQPSLAQKAEWTTSASTQRTQVNDAVDLQTSEDEHKLSQFASIRSRLGLHPNPPVDEEHKVQEHQNLQWSRIRLVLREPFAEFWGTFIMVLFGNGSVAQVLLSTGQATAPGGNGFGDYQSISWGYAHFSSPNLLPLSKYILC